MKKTPKGLLSSKHPFLAGKAEGRVTPFQRKVYEAILTIPKGQVRSYGWVARRIGQPKAARAVGQALKRNRWAPAVPCHRVISSDGTLGGPDCGGTSPVRAAWRLPKELLGGYSGPGGVTAKRRLLRREGAVDGIV